MTSFQSNSPIPNASSAVATGVALSDPFITVFQTRDPNTFDNQYPIKKRWINFTTPTEWILQSFTNVSGQSLANWVLIAMGTNQSIIHIGVPLGTSPITPDVNGLVNFTSTGGTIAITGTAGGLGNQNINFDITASGSNVQQFTVDGNSAPGTNPVPPTGGNINLFGTTVAPHSVPIRTFSDAASTIHIQQQLTTTSTSAAKTVNNAGLSSFNSVQFTVDAATGFISLVGSNAPVLQTITGDDTVAVSPNASGNINLQGLVVANATHAKAVFTESPGANTEKIDIQVSAAIAATDITKVGLAAFDSARFTVDANGFVSINGSGVGETITGDSGGALPPSSGNWNILGRSGSKTSGSGSTLTVKSPPFQDQGGSTTVTLNSGSFATAAITLTLPVSAGLADGDLFEFVCTTASALVIQAVGAQKIRIGSLISSAAGTATSSNIGDSVSLRFRAADGFLYATSVIGTWVLA